MSTTPPAPSTAVAIRPAASGFGLVMSPQTIEATREFCLMLSKTEFVPKAFRGKPDSIMVVGAMGHRLGLDIFAAMAGIADINGRPTIWGDSMLAVVLNCAEFEDIEEVFEGKAYEDTFRAVCTVKRTGKAPTVRSFSVIEAKEAGLWKKPGPWTNTPQRMLQMRARAFACRDRFADALAGFQLREEAEDLVDVTADAVVHAEPRPAKTRTIEASGAPADPPADGKPADAPPAEQGQGAATDPPVEQKPEPTTARCQDVTAALMKRGAGGKALVAGIMKRWSLTLVTDLAQLDDDDRQAYIDEVAEADAKLEPATGGKV